MSGKRQGRPEKGDDNKRKRSNRNGRNIWDMITDVAIHVLNKGQVGPATVAALLILVTFRYPDELLPSLVHEVMEYFDNWKLLGWGLSVLTLVVWFVHVRALKRQFSTETARIGKEKSRLQSDAAGRKLNSSNDR